MILNNLTAASSANKATLTKTAEVKEQTKNAEANAVTIEKDSGSKALSNYFRAGQNIEFKGHNCSKSSFKVKKQEGIPCACCGRPMMTNNQMDKFVTETKGKKGDELIGQLNNFSEYFRGTEKAVVNFFIKTAAMNKDATMSGLLTQFNPDAKTILEVEQKEVMAKADTQAKAALGDKNPISECIAKGIDLINNSTNEKHFSRKEFLANLQEASKNVSNKEVATNVLDTAAHLPTSGDSIASFIVKYCRKDDESIARRLLQTAVATAEHVHPDTLGGADHTSNYIGECGDCNSKRGHMPLEEWMQEYPNMPSNVQKNMDEVTERIIKGDLGHNYDDYPIDIQATMDRETNGIIKLKVKNPEEIDKIREERGIPKPLAPQQSPRQYS